MMQTLLLSGGIDSVAVLSIYDPRRTLFVDYGQLAAPQERSASRRWADRFGTEHFEITISGLALGAMLDRSGVPGPRVVQARNALLISCAANLCESGDEVLIGAQRGDAENYPDCRFGFIEKIGESFARAYGVAVSAPLIDWPRPRIFAALAERHVEFQSCWSCYAPLPNGHPCGQCDSCKQPR
jgi:7-cyano-7-deazaguanine synthase